MTAYVCTRFAYEDVHCRRILSDLIAMSAIANFDATIGGVDRSGRYFVTESVAARRAQSAWVANLHPLFLRPGEPDASVRAPLKR